MKTCENLTERCVGNKIFSELHSLKLATTLLKLTAKAPDNRPKPNGKGLYFNHPFVGANCLLVSDFRKGRIHRIGIFYQLEIYH